MLNLKMISLKSKETLGDSLKKTNKILSKFKYLRGIVCKNRRSKKIEC